MSTMDEKTLQKLFDQQLEKLLNEMKKPGVLLMGATGVGKSSLLNEIFGRDIAATGVGSPYTKKIDVYESKDCAVRLYDSKGYEVGKDAEFENDVLAKLQNASQKDINVVWYCISCLGGRVQDIDLKAISKISNTNCPIAVILTKADGEDEETISALRKTLRSEFTDESILPIFEFTIKLPEFCQKKELVEWTIQKMPEQLKMAFVAEQTELLAAKKEEVRKIIKQSVVAAAAATATPIPFADSALLVSNELAMMARILKVYNLGNLSSAFEKMGLGSVLCGLLTKCGRALAGNLIKLIPGVGSILGATINAAVASSITWTLGIAISRTCEMAWEKLLSGKKDDLVHILEQFAPMVGETAKALAQKGKISEKDM